MFIPDIYAYWNGVKDGSDTATKLMDKCTLHVPKSYSNAETTAVSCLIMLFFVTSCQLHQVTTAKPNNDYPSLTLYPNLANKHSTIKCSILEGHIVFREELDKMKEQQTHATSALQEMTQNQRNTQNQRRQPSRTRVNNVLLEQTNFGAVLQIKNPKKMNYQIKWGTVAPESKEMVEKCTGIPLKTLPVQFRSACSAMEIPHGSTQGVNDPFVWKEEQLTAVQKN